MEDPKSIEELKRALAALEGVTPRQAYLIRAFREARDKFLSLQREFGHAGKHYNTLFFFQEKRDQYDELYRKLGMAREQMDIIREQLNKTLDD